MMMSIFIKQHLSNVWSSIHEEVKQHWGWVEKKCCLQEKSVYVNYKLIIRLIKITFSLIYELLVIPWMICGRQPLYHITSNFLKAVFHKFPLVHSWILCPICQISWLSIIWNILSNMFIEPKKLISHCLNSG